MVKDRSVRPMADVVCFATQGTGHGEEARIKALLGKVGAEALPFNRMKRARSAWTLLRLLLTRRPDLVVMEGTGVAGGVPLISARILADVPYVVSSGDAVGPYIRLTHPRLAPAAAIYERLLCRLSAGYIGWTPYLVGRALTFGAPRAITAANWSAPARPQERGRRREELDIPAGALVFGLVGSLEWTEGIDYCYGRELVDAVLKVERDDLRVIILGDGSGRDRLRAIAGDELGKRVLLPGRIPRESVTSYLAAMDVASLPQSVDGVGSFRYTTKISEYLGAGLPLVTGQTPLSYDLDEGWIWRLAGDAPWDPRYIADLADLMQTLTPKELAIKRQAVQTFLPAFDRERQEKQVGQFVTDLLRAGGRWNAAD
jgi:Glycosyl transferases group 1/Glycosyl transferase 4-like domain